MSRQFTERLQEGQAVGGAYPQTINNSSISSQALWMGRIRRARGFLWIGAITSSGSVNFLAQSSATSGGSYATITTSTNTQLTVAPSITAIVTQNSYNAIEVRADQMTPGQPYLKFTATETASQNVVAAIFVVGDCSADGPGNQSDGVTWTNNIYAQP